LQPQNGTVGLSDVKEYLCESNAKDAASKQAFNESELNVVRWASEPNRIYTINATTSLVSTAFAPIATELRATPPENAYTNLGNAAAMFYQMELE
jgi:hypothetical protein